MGTDTTRLRSPSGSAPVRVLHLRDSPWVDGPGRTIIETGASVDRSRVDFHVGVLVPAVDGNHPMLNAAATRGLQAVPLVDSGGLSGELLDRIVALIDAHGINVVHASEFRSGLLAQLVRRRRPVRLVVTAHGWVANTMRRRMIRFLDKVMLRRFDRVILVSHAMRDLVPKWWLPDSRVHVLHNCLVLGSYGREVVDRPRSIWTTAQPLRIACVGRLSPEKGHSILLQAISLLHQRVPSLRLRIAGVGPLEGQLRKQSAALGIAEKVEFLGFVSDMPRLYAETDLVVQASSTEGLPNVILESAYLRVPTIATAVGGTGEVISHGQTGWLIEPRVEEILSALNRFVENPREFHDMAQRAHHRILECFSFEARTARLMQIYEALASTGR